MLTKIISRHLQFKGIFNTKIPLFKFSSDHHDHHDYSVHIDKNCTWIKYKTNRSLACLQGIEDTHYPMKDPDDSDPFVHIKQNPVFSLQNLAYNDAYYHEDDHEALVNQPHGYAAGSDPIDSRYDITEPSVYAMGSLIVLLYIILSLEQINSSEGIIYREKLAIDFVEGNLHNKNAELNDIKDKIQELSNKH